MKSKKKIKSALYSIICVLLVLIALLFVGAALPGTNYSIKTVLSGSMEPVIRVGSVIVVRPTGSYEIGDIITFETRRGSGIPTTHRIEDIRVEGGRPIYITKGDANPITDITEVREADIIGKTIFSIPYLGYMIEFVRKPMGFALVVILPATLVVISEVYKIYFQIKKKKTKVSQ